MGMKREELHGGHRSVSGGLARAAVFGINDGLVSNVSLILGFAGSGVDTSVVRLAGLAGAIAGGISMAAGAASGSNFSMMMAVPPILMVRFTAACGAEW